MTSNHQSFLAACEREGMSFIKGVYAIVCGCTRRAERKPGQNLPPQIVAKKFKQEGWSQRSKIWTCLSCQLEERRKHVSHAKPGVVLTIDKPAAPSIEPSIKQALAIAAILDQHFDVPGGFYDADWSDDEVAKKLNLPRAMVAKVREEGYGPLKAPPELMRLRDDIRDGQVILDDLRKRVDAELAKYGVRA